MCEKCEQLRKEVIGKRLKITVKIPRDYFSMLSDSGMMEIKAQEWGDMIAATGLVEFQLIIKGKHRKNIALAAKNIFGHEAEKLADVLDKMREAYEFINQ